MKNRIEYIDAMRGFTMILVVFGHILSYGYGGFPNVTFQNIFVLFRMPLFFFVSGFVFYKSTRTWTFQETGSFLKQKFLVQIIPTSIFLFINCWIFNSSFYEAITNSHKGGYWFTITLFEFFLTYSLISLLKIKKNEWILFTIALFYILIGLGPVRLYLERIGLDYGILSIIQLRYFIYFLFGIFIRKHFEDFISVLDNKYYSAIIIVSFFLLGLAINKEEWSHDIRGGLAGIAGLLGIMTVFGFFKRYQHSFLKEKRMGCYLQYIGRRTLDIYLLHYFFIPRNLHFMNHWFNEYANPSLEFLISLLLSIWVIILCLIVSNILRASDFLANILFGVKKL